MVEWTSIGSLLTRKRKKAKQMNEVAPVYAVTNDKGFVLSSSLHDFTIHSEDTSNYMVVEKNDFAYNPSRLNIGSIAYFSDEGKGLISPMYVVFHADEEKVLSAYLFITIKSEAIRNKIDSLKEVGARFRFDFERWNLIKIPIPPLSEQTRIVSLLDTFTSSITNLKQQIAERRKQYEHYRDQLLDLEGKEGVEMKTLGEVVSSDCSLSYGIVQPGEDVIDGIPVVRPVDLISTYIKLDGLKKTQQQISESYKRTILRGNEILFCVRGTTGTMGLATSELKGCNVTRGIVPISFDNEITKMFVFYQLKSFRLQKIIDEKTNGTALRQINIKDLRLLHLCFPPLSEQSRIVSLLDTFEASISNLEAQLKEREKQYEYYRNQLLSFK